MSVPVASVPSMIIDCETCTVRGVACADCVVTFLTIPLRAGVRDGPRPAVTAAGPGAAGAIDLEPDEQAALGVLAACGLVPPLRLERVV